MKKATIIALLALMAVLTIQAAQPMDFYAKKAEEAIAIILPDFQTDIIMAV